MSLLASFYFLSLYSIITIGFHSCSYIDIYCTMNTTEIPQLYQIMQVRDPLLPSPKSRLTEQMISRTFKSVAHLANLLPTGTVLAFQLLSPVFTNQGQCDYACRYMTCLLITLCAASCLLLSFTDSFTVS